MLGSVLYFFRNGTQYHFYQQYVCLCVCLTDIHSTWTEGGKTSKDYSSHITVYIQVDYLYE